MLTIGVPAGSPGVGTGWLPIVSGAAQPGQPGPDPPQQLAGRLAGERQTQHLTRFGVAVGDQPHHPGGHRLGFPGARARDDHQRPRRRGDDRRLLRRSARKHLAHKPIRPGCSALAHCAVIAAPSVGADWAGQLGRSGQCAQPSLTRAMNCGPAVASAASPDAGCATRPAPRVSAGPARVRWRPRRPVCPGRPAARRPARRPAATSPSATANW